MKKGLDLSYVMQDHLGSTRGTVDNSGNVETISYFSFGGVRFASGSLPTDRKFTGQRQDSTGLYYYGARYYDPEIGRFISADTVVQNPANPQTLNRYSYCLNNPLKYVDPSGHTVTIDGQDIGQLYADTAEYDFNTWSQYADVMTSSMFEAYDIARLSAMDAFQDMESPYTLTFNVVWGNLEGTCGDTGPNVGGIVNITIDYELQKYGSLATATTLGHEMVHGYATLLSTDAGYNSKFEEALANEFACKIAKDNSYTLPMPNWFQRNLVSGPDYLYANALRTQVHQTLNVNGVNALTDYSMGAKNQLDALSAAFKGSALGSWFGDYPSKGGWDHITGMAKTSMLNFWANQFLGN